MLKAIFELILIQASLLGSIPKHNKQEDTNGNSLAIRLLQESLLTKKKKKKIKEILGPSWMPVHMKYEDHFHSWDVITNFITLCLSSHIRTNLCLPYISQSITSNSAYHLWENYIQDSLIP